MIAYKLSGKNNDSYYFDNAPNELFCSNCDSLLENDFVPSDLKVSKNVLDVSYTYDHRLIISQKMKDLCIRLGCRQDDFKLVNTVQKLYLFCPKNIINFDTDKRKTRFDNYCKQCGNYESITGATPVFLKNIDKPIFDGFFCTDIKFGTGREKFPLIIVGINTFKFIKKEKIKGVEFTKIY